MYQNPKILSILSLFVLGVVPQVLAQYSHFPITHLDWELIDFDESSLNQPAFGGKKNKSLHSSYVEWEQPWTTSYLLSPCELLSENKTLTPLLGLVALEPSEPVADGSFEFISENQAWLASPDQADYSLSAEILEFLKTLLTTDENSSLFDRVNNVQDRSSWIWQPQFPTEQEYKNSAISSHANLRIARPFNHSLSLSTHSATISDNPSYISKPYAKKDFVLPTKVIQENYSRHEPTSFFDVFAAKFDEELLLLLGND
jgi:hypothetical protein